jgi:hypothetical protein
VSKYVVQIGSDVPVQIQRFVVDLQKELNRISAHIETLQAADVTLQAATDDISTDVESLQTATDVVIPSFAVADLPVDGSSNIAIVTDDSLYPTASLAFYVSGIWYRSNDFTVVT